MKPNRIKSSTFISGKPENIYAETADIFVTLEDDDDEYFLAFYGRFVGFSDNISNIPSAIYR